MVFPTPVENTLLQESVADQQHDLEEICYLLDDGMNRLTLFLRDLRKVKSHIDTGVFQEMITTTQGFRDIYRQHKEIIKTTITTIHRAVPSYTMLMRGQEIIQTNHEFLRSYQARIGALITSTDWQSPSYDHSMHSEAGRQINTIYATINDYKRDQHWDAYRYEQSFLKQYIDALVKFPVQVLATSSGMAAFTTILNFLILEHKAVRPVLVGKSTRTPGYTTKTPWRSFLCPLFRCSSHVISCF